MTQWILFYIFIGLGGLWTLIWLYLVLSVPRVEDEEIVDRGTVRLRHWIIGPMIAALLIGFALSMYFMPYPSRRAATVGQPTVSVNVAGIQWAWIIDKKEIPANTPVEFVLTSRDVNHDFAIYDAGGRLLTQAQVMPGYTNRLIYKFDKPGTYTVRCLEYCGIGHTGMLVTLNVV